MIKLLRIKRKILIENIKRPGNQRNREEKKSSEYNNNDIVLYSQARDIAAEVGGGRQKERAAGGLAPLSRRGTVQRGELRLHWNQ